MPHPLIQSLCLAVTVVTAAVAQPPRPNDPRAVALFDRATERMGGETVLRSVTSLRMDIITQWQRTSFGDHPYSDNPSYERVTDLRDYATHSWRNTRSFFGGGTRVEIVRDRVGAFAAAGANGAVAQGALNVAYVDERRELFAFAPERTLLLARDGGGMRRLADTTIGGVVHARVAATVDGYPATYFMRATDGLPAMVRFRADETNDFGLAPWGEMDVEVWFSNWTRLAPGVLLPRQRDVRRVGRPYKRMTLLSAAINAPAPADSFAIADSTAAQFWATQNKAMWDTPLDSVKLEFKDFVTFPRSSGSSGAVRVGGQWVLLETGQAKGAASLLHEWLSRRTPESRVAVGIVSFATTGNGGAVWFAERGLSLYAPVGAAAMLRAMPGGARAAKRATTVATGRWFSVGTDSLWIEPLVVPDQPGVLAVYSLAHRWLYCALMGAPVAKSEQDALIARLRSRGLPVEWLGSVRTMRSAAPSGP